jgi:precorrin-6B methylase 2
MDYRELLLLRAARETGMLDALASSADTPEAVAAETGVTERAAEVTVRALAEMGLVEQVGDAWEPTNRMLGFVATRDVRSVGSLPHRLDCLDGWIALPETMRTGEPPERPDDWTRHHAGSLASLDDATVRACVTAAVREHPDADRVLDVAGGPGAFAREFARRGRDVTVFEQPEMAAEARRNLAAEPVSVVAGDARRALSQGFDLAFVARTLQALGPDDGRAILDRVADALDPGGTVVVVELLRARSAGAAAFAAHMLALTEAGDVYSEGTLREWLEDAGFADVRTAAIPGTDLFAVAGDRPRH